MSRLAEGTNVPVWLQGPQIIVSKAFVTLIRLQIFLRASGRQSSARPELATRLGGVAPLKGIKLTMKIDM